MFSAFIFGDVKIFYSLILISDIILGSESKEYVAPSGKRNELADVSNHVYVVTSVSVRGLGTASNLPGMVEEGYWIKCMMVYLMMYRKSAGT